MAVSQKVLNEKLREKFLKIVGEILKEKDEEVLRTGSNEIAVPCLDEEGNEKFVVLTIKVPTGSRDGDAYDGYSMAEFHQRFSKIFLSIFHSRLFAILPFRLPLSFIFYSNYITLFSTCQLFFFFFFFPFPLYLLYQNFLEKSRFDKKFVTL